MFVFLHPKYLACAKMYVKMAFDRSVSLFFAYEQASHDPSLMGVCKQGEAECLPLQ